MKLWRVVLIIIGTLLLLMSCKQPTNDEILYKAQKKLGEMKSYQCKATIYVEDEKGEREYSFIQMYKYPNKYRLEAISPEEYMGYTTIYNGKSAWIINPSINQIWKTNSFEKSGEQLMFVGNFMENLISNEEANIYKDSFNNGEYIVLETPLSGGNFYFNKQKLWISTKSLHPAHLQVLDEEGSIRYRVDFDEFQYNSPLEEDLFYIHTNEN
ncbi:LolA family protein [Alkaliphilus serpentinus]|uniref:Outer membrane lipoprotein carrier protein LolA n=1 Tax=Alkaliphilus serpentinus TaxID=1482731 RepID=A0A833MAX9_9FIRM|nr:outer-membrane lipoprotein carrier protein LolA [Alkaliphilus serpentinus]KAB3533559.1 outer membrane lipoprotein carrier protein LolA [Alkaliphilus serpentinus]